MLNTYFTQRNTLTSGDLITWNIQGYSSLGLDVAGTFTSGSFTLQGSNDGSTWTTLQAADGDGLIEDGIISATGHYLFNILGFNVVKLVESSLNVSLVLTALGTTEIAGVFTGVSPVDPVFPGIISSVLFTNGTGEVEGAPIGDVGDVLMVSGTGTGTYGGIVSDGTDLYALKTGGDVLKSTDGGSSWTTISNVTSARFISFGNSLFIVGCTAGALFTSSDAVTWTSRTTGVATNLDCAVWTGTAFVVGGQTATILTSPTGETWTAQTFGGAVEVRALAWSGTVIVATGANMVKTSDATAVTWTSRTPAYTDTTWSVVWDSTLSLFVGVSSAGKIQTSPTGTTWTQRTSGIATDLYGITTSGTALVAVGANAGIVSSTNGTTWTVRTVSITSSIDLNGVTIQDGDFFAVGEDGVVITSVDDGSTWSVFTNATPSFVTPEGNGVPLMQDGDKTINGTVTFPTPIRESSILSAPVLATDAEGDHVAGTTTGTGSVVMLAESPTTTGTFTGEAANWSGEQTVSAGLSATRISSTAGIVDLDAATGNNFFQLDAGKIKTAQGGVIANEISSTLSRTYVAAQFDDNVEADSYSVGGVSGDSGTFTTADAKTVTVVNGIITSIV